MMSSAIPSRPLRVGLVGTGIGRMHAAGYARLAGRAELVAVCAQRLADAESLATEFGAGLATSRYEDLLEYPHIDAIDLCVPHHLHMPMAVAAARAGKHILVEKPIARTLAEADAIIAAARAAGVTLMVSHNQRYFDHHAKAKALLEAGAIGRPFMIVAVVHVNGHIGGFRRSLVQAGGGALIDSGVHRFDLMRWLMGDVESVYAQTGRFVQMQMEGEDCAAVVLRFRSGAIGSFSCTWSAKVSRPVESLQIFADRGSIYTEDHTRSVILHAETRPGGPHSVREFSFATDQAASIGLAVEAFVESVRQGREPPVSGEDGRAALELALASYEAARLERPATLPLQLAASFAGETTSPV